MSPLVKIDANTEEIRNDVVAIAELLVQEYGYDGAKLLAFAARFFLTVGLSLADLSETDGGRLERQAALLRLLEDISRIVGEQVIPITDPKLAN